MFFIIYISLAKKAFSQSELIELLTKVRANNEKLGVTGMLLYKVGNFMQILEGDEEVVRELLAKIKDDQRHYGIITLMEGTQSERQFPDWSMGFRDLTSVDLHSIPGYSEFMNSPLGGEGFSAGNPTLCKNFMLAFKKNIR